MTIEKLARFIVEDHYEGTIGDEKYNINVALEVDRMRNDIQYQSNDPKIAIVIIEES
jgi:hypothetical protein